VALVSDKVRIKNDAFRDATAQYIREAEVLNFNPNDQRQKEKVSELIALRKKRMSELAEEIKLAIDDEITKADQHIAEFSLQRDRVELGLARALQDRDYFKVVISGDRAAKTRVNEQLIKERANVKNELDGLTQLLTGGEIKLYTE
jgi:hypothetical protein